MKKLLFFLGIAIILTINANAQPGADYSNPDQMIKPDPTITIGTLDNGLKYYIKENKKPENRAILRLIVKAGSVLENDNQAGLAHFLEHMCFNGTKNFPKNELVSFLESTGMRFGADVNAATGFDQTYYMLEIPMDKEGLLEKGFQVLEDWAHNVSFSPEEIEKERGVIMEEWRVYRGANERVMRKHYPVLFYKSKYADRLPIGDTAIIKHAPRERFVEFYTDWYRPNLMAVIAVGDFNKAEIEKMIKEKFGRIKNPANMKERVEFEIPSHKETLVSIATDKELQMPMVQMYFKFPAREEGTYGEYKESIKERLISTMLTNRLNELTREKNPPFMYAGGGIGRFISNLATFTLIAVPKTEQGGVINGVDALLTEAFRAMKYGFVETELDRTKKQMIRGMENAYNEKDKTNSNAFASEYMRNFLQDEPIPGIEVELALYKKLLPEITLDQINDMVKKYIRKQDLVIAISAPEKEGVVVPNEQEVLATYDNASKKKLEPYVDQVSDEPLIAKEIKPGKITGVKNIDKIGVTEFKLSNGARVILKPTDFKNDQILFRAYSPGGTSLSSDDIYYSAAYANNIIDECGISNFSLTELEKKLSDKVVSLSPGIGELTEGFSGSCSPDDMETFFQLLYLYFTNPRLDYEASETFLNKQKEMIANSKVSPDNAFRDTISVTMANYHERSKPWTEAMIEEIDPDDAYDFYRDRFADAGDFTFFLVGAFDVDKIKPMIEKYVASLPTTKRVEKWKDLGERYPKGKINKKIYKGMEKKSTVYLSMTGDFDYTPKNRLALNSVTELLRILLREAIREEKGGTYGVGVFSRMEEYPAGRYSFNVYFNTNPDRVPELTGEIKAVIDNFLENGPEQKNVDKVKEILTRKHETDLKENRFWLNVLYSKYFHEEDPTTIPDFDKKVAEITTESIHKAAKKYIKYDNFVEIIMYPENYTN